MAQIFPRQANVLSRLSVVVILLLIGIVAWALWFFNLSNWARSVGPTWGQIEQPVPYSHAFHVGGLQIDCRFCHNHVEESGYANVPSTQTCMSCHSVIRTDSPNLQPVRESWATGAPIAWNKVHDLPGFVYFNHSSHIAKGVGCSTCHGQVSAMPVVYKTQALYMSWCLECHRAPEEHVRPRDQIFNANYVPPPNQAELGAQLVREYGIRGANQLTNCWICHR